MSSVIHLLHRMPALADAGPRPAAALQAYLDQLVVALESTVDGVVISHSFSCAHSLAVDPFAVAAGLLARTGRGRIAIADIALGILPPDEIVRRASHLAVLGGERIALGLSLGRPRDYWVANVHPARARAAFDAALQALLWALGRLDGNDIVGRQPQFRSLPRLTEGLARPEVFISGTFCRENRSAIDRFNLPYLAYGLGEDGSPHAMGASSRRMSLFRVLLAETNAVAGDATDDGWAFCEKGAPPCYFDAEDYRTHLVNPVSAGAKVLSGSSLEIAREIEGAVATGGSAAVVIDPCVPGLTSTQLAQNIAGVTRDLVPLVRARMQRSHA